MPTGQPEPPRYNDLSQLRYRETAAAAQRIERAYEASSAYLDGQAP
jgi:NTE family protein